MAGVKARPDRRLRFISAAGFVTGAAIVAAFVILLGSVRPSAFVGYLVILGGLIGGLVFVSTAAAVGIAPIRDRIASTLVVSGLGASIATIGVGYLLIAHPAGNHLHLVGLATLVGAGGWGLRQLRLGVLDPMGIALGLGLSAIVTVGMFALTWAVGVFCKMVGL